MKLHEAGLQPNAQNVADLSPEELVLTLYDLGIEGCKEKNPEKVLKVINELIAALNFDYYETANRFLNVYKYAIYILESHNFQEVENILTELRFAWDSFVTAKKGVEEPLNCEMS